MNQQQKLIRRAAEELVKAKRVAAFTGAGISVESGIPPFRGENGIWNKYNPRFLEIEYFEAYPKICWENIIKMFYDSIATAKPNPAHDVLAWMEKGGLAGFEAVITQNIDNLHNKAGSEVVWEFHGNSQRVICMNCGEQNDADKIDLTKLPPRCGKCKGILKPDFVFFGEAIPIEAGERSFWLAENVDVMLVIGTTGEVMPANMIPFVAKRTGALIIEINTAESIFSEKITDIFLQGKATDIMLELKQILSLNSLAQEKN
ncbi:MAG: NAD-dependent protein deacylase [Candidatus Cloacimonetes bacterium]|nr:NAD-dependent protein deacylase [Candidatus Cloacimonadota bacterium]